MNNKNNKRGFALILSIVLLLVMSLMGGSLVVIASSDHRSNNYTDHYQQTFYVAETALLEAEKYLVNTYLGLKKREIASNGDESLGPADPANKGKHPTNSNTADNDSVCYKSFKNIINLTDVFVHHKNGSFLNIIYPALIESNLSDPTDADDKEVDYLDKFKYEYFIENVGDADFTESGSSIALGSLDVINRGTAYRIYGCGIYDSNETVIPLESLVVLPG